MFTIKPIDNYKPEQKLIYKGARLGYYGEPMTFEMVSEINTNALFIDVFCVIEPNSKQMLETQPIVGNRVSVVIKNPHPNTASTFLKPQQILYVIKGNVQLTLKCVLFQLGNAEHFLFYYEFYEEPFNPKSEESPKQGGAV